MLILRSPKTQLLPLISLPKRIRFEVKNPKKNNGHILSQTYAIMSTSLEIQCTPWSNVRYEQANIHIQKTGTGNSLSLGKL